MSAINEENAYFKRKKNTFLQNWQKCVNFFNFLRKSVSTDRQYKNTINLLYLIKIFTSVLLSLCPFLFKFEPEVSG